MPSVPVRFLFVLVPILTLVGCQSHYQGTSSTKTPEEQNISYDLLPPPGGEGEMILNEKREEVKNSKREIAFFQKPSDIPNELFRVYVASDQYMVRQIRGTDKIQRRPDAAGDDITKEELKRLDLINFLDDGYVLIGLGASSGKLESISFDRRVPRINDVAKILQNDASRWFYEHSDGKPTITKFIINYQVRLYPNKSREEVQEMLRKKK